MEPQVTSNTTGTGLPTAPSRAGATVLTRKNLYRYELRNLQVVGATLHGGPPPPDRRVFDIILEIPFYPPIRLHARNAGPTVDGGYRVAFIHTSDFTEDHIQAALLSELERSHH